MYPHMMRSGRRRGFRRRYTDLFPITINFDGDEPDFFDGGWAEAGGVVKNDQLILGSELIVNGDFTNWTGDDPDDFTVIGEVGADPEVSEVGTGEAHGGAGTEACNFFSSVADNLALRQADVFIPHDWYQHTANISKYNSGRLRMSDSSNGIIVDQTSEGVKVISGKSVGKALAAAHVALGGDLTIDNYSVKKITFTSIMNALKSQFGLADGFFIELELDSYTAGSTLGVMWNIDNVSNPQNFGLAMFLQFTNSIRVRTTKRVAGTYTDLSTVVQAFTSSQVLRIENPSGTNVLDILYNGVSIATPTIADAGIISNTGIALLSTEENNAISQVTIGRL